MSDSRKTSGHVGKGRRERTLLSGWLDNVAALLNSLFQQKTRGHHPVLLAELQSGDHLFKPAGDLLQTAYIVFIVTNGIERSIGGDLRKVDLNSVELIDGHLPKLQIDGPDLIIERTKQEPAIELILFTHVGQVDGA